jgi:hypothetical protein
MRTARFSAKALREFLKQCGIATMTDLKSVLRTRTNMTVYRKLKELSYHTSYSHQGKYYTLDEIARFDEMGLWAYEDVHFSRHGTLIKTIRVLIDQSVRGYTLSELRSVLGVEVKESLLVLYNREDVQRERIAGRYVYFSVHSETQRRQMLMRMDGSAAPTTANTESLMAHELRAAIILFFSILDEQQRRLYAGLESLRIGRGGDATISRFLGVDPHTVSRGRKALLERDINIDRARRKGGGRSSAKKNAGNN